MKQEKLYELMETLGFVKNLPDDPKDYHWYHGESDLLIDIPPVYETGTEIMELILCDVAKRNYESGRESVMKQMRDLIGIRFDGPQHPDSLQHS